MSFIFNLREDLHPLDNCMAETSDYFLNLGKIAKINARLLQYIIGCILHQPSRAFVKIIDRVCKIIESSASSFLFLPLASILGSFLETHCIIWSLNFSR